MFRDKFFESAELTDILLGLLIGLLVIAMRWVAKKAQLDAAQTEVMEEMLLAMQDVRRKVIDTIVKAKEDGKITAEEKELIFTVAKAELLARVGPKAKQLVLSWGEQKVRGLIALALQKAGVSLDELQSPSDGSAGLAADGAAVSPPATGG